MSIAMAAGEAALSSSGIDGSEVPSSFWQSLSYFNIYRLAVAVPALGVALVFHDALSLGSHNQALFTYVSAFYVFASVSFHLAMRKWRVWFNAQLSAHVLTDIVTITLLMHASSGMRSGLGVMLLISLAGAALVSRGTLMLFYSAMASIAVLLEQTYWILIEDHATSSYLQPGLMSMGYFATALITNQLAQRLIMNERVARLRGADLANQLRINQLVIQDVQVGVMVVDANGLVRLHNRQVAELLGGAAPELDQIERYSLDIARALEDWRAGAGHDTANVYFEESAKMVRARFIAAGVAGSSFALVFLENMSKQQELAQQLKLAALGRLTANIAHEIRNPLSAITHASDLLREEAPVGASARLVNIIQDNARRLDRMVKDVLELSRRDRVQTVDIALGGYLRDFATEFSGNEGIPRESIQLEVPGELTVEFDRTHLNQVLWNLMRNAWRHSTKGANCIRVRASRRGARTELHVIDDGGGVPRDLQSQLFEPFFTTFSSGTGLGLYIAKELCAANGASLEYVPSGTGADFRIQWQPN